MASMNLLSVDPIKVDRDPIPRGRYHFKISKTTWGTSKNGNPTGSVHLKVLNGQYAGKVCFINIVATEKAMGFFRAYMEGILGKEGFAAFAKGCDGEDMAGIAKKVAAKAKKLFESGKLVDIEVVGAVRVTKNLQGQDTNTVDSIAPADEVEEVEDDDSEGGDGDDDGEE